MNINTKQPIGKALSDGDWGYIQQRINDRFDCEVSLENVQNVFTKERNKVPKGLGDGWSDSTWIMWLKNRIHFKCGKQSGNQGKLNPLHVFFISIPEDMRMIGRLKDDSWFPSEGTSRSRISGSQLTEINPINREAWLVASK